MAKNPVATKSVDPSDPAFRSWFGRSVTHERGVPHRFYTGTSKDVDFPDFKVARHGAWFTRDPKEASSYAEQNDSKNLKYNLDTRKYERVNDADRVIPAYLKAENPYRGPRPQHIHAAVNYKKAQSDWFDTLRAQGHDSWIPDELNGELAVILGHPGQSKSAISNTGDFDPDQKRIDRANGGIVDAALNAVSKHRADGGGAYDENLARYMEGNHPDVPHVVYHGTTHDVGNFDTSKGAWFSSTPQLANEYASEINGNVVPVHLSIKKPIEFNHAEQRKNVGEIISHALNGADDLSPKQIEKAKSLISSLRKTHGDKPKELFEFWRNDPNIAELFRTLKYDGISAFERADKKNKTWAALHPNQIKSAIGNQGTFDPSDPDITKAGGGLVDSALNIINPVSVFPKPQRMFPADQQVPGGQYVNAKTKEDMTGHKAAAASIGVLPGGKPYFNASEDAVDETGTPGRGSAMAKTNLFKQKAGWKWSKAPEGHEGTNTIVSVEHRGDHHYALNAHFPKGVDLARYENASSEPRLRPTTRGNLTKGKQVGTIFVRGREHPVYDHVIVKADGGIVDAALDIARRHKVR